MSIKHRAITRLFHAIQIVGHARAVIVDRALIDSVVMIDSRTGKYEVIGAPVQVRRGREGEWLVTEVEELVPA